MDTNGKGQFGIEWEWDEGGRQWEWFDTERERTEALERHDWNQKREASENKDHTRILLGSNN